MRRVSDVGNGWWLLCVFVLAGVLALMKPSPEPIKIKLPTTEQVGESVGKQSVRFTKGLIEGVKEQVSK